MAPIGKTPIVKVQKTRVASHTILGAISMYGFVNISFRLPNVPNPIVAGTTIDQYIKFLGDTMDELDNYEYMENCYLNMNNALIHKREIIDQIISGRGYRCVYLPPYSLELIPIEQFWSVTKSKLKPVQMLDEENLQTRISDTCFDVPNNHIYGFVTHSASCLNDCLNKLPM